MLERLRDQPGIEVKGLVRCDAREGRRAAESSWSVGLSRAPLPYHSPPLCDAPF